MSNNYPIFPDHAPIQGTYAFTLEQVTKLCEMQDTLNSYIHPEWKLQGFNWMLAIQDEIMEIHGHLGWKWWKGDYNVGLTAENLRQVQLEVIDILHFVISQWMHKGYVQYLRDNFNDRIYGYPIDYWLGNLQRCSWDMLAEIWTGLAKAVGLTEQMVMETYTQKYVLNKFRQDHGYKDGSYCKHWTSNYFRDENDNTITATKEDNEVLAYMVNYMKSQNDPDVADETVLYEGLEFWYTNRLNQ